MGKNFEIEIFVLKYVLDHSESIPTKKIFSTKNFCLCHFFDQKWPKIEVFWQFFSKKIFVPTFRTFYCGSFEPSYSCVPLTFAEIFPSEQIGARSSSTIWSSWVLSDQSTRTGIGARVWSGLSVLGDDWSCDSHFSKKRLCPQRKVIMGKNFEIETFWIDSDPNNFFDQNFLSLPFFRPVIPFFEKMAMSSYNKKLFSKSRFSF